MNNNLTANIKEFAFELGVSLVGVAPIERFKNAPVMMSPQGIMPTAKNVIVCAIHHPDGAIQMGGEKHPQDIGPYSIQYAINSKLDHISYKIANQLNSLGYDAVAIASSNIWRYRPFMDLKADFAPDMSHIYAATCAGLGNLGWHGMTMTPEYGAWNRFTSIITDAPLAATPMYDEKLCDMCGECINHCPTNAYRKEVRGVNVIEVDGREFKFANKNLWRCAWAEHFDIDLDLEIPEKVDEQVLLDYIAKYGKRGGEMGCCLKWCLPKHLRQDGGEFTSTYRRRKHAYASDLPVHRALYDEISAKARKYSVDDLAFIDTETLEKSGVNYKQYLPNATSAVAYAIKVKKNGAEFGGNYHSALNDFNVFANLDITLAIENAGYESVCSVPEADNIAMAAGITSCSEYAVIYGAVLATAPFKTQLFTCLQEPIYNKRKTLTENLYELISNEGSDNFAAVNAETINKLSDTINKTKGGETLFKVKDKNIPHMPYDPVVTKIRRKIHRPSDYVKGAESVIIFSLHYPDIVVQNALKPPAYAIGPYVYASYETNFQLNYSGLKIVKYLQNLGYNAVMTHDLTGIAGETGSPRGFIADAKCNSIEAVAAGIGELALNGTCCTAEHGFNQRFMAIVTDAPIEDFVHGKKSDRVQERCKGCERCIQSCPAKALDAKDIVKLELNGINYCWLPADGAKCEWAKKNCLCAEEGVKYTGANTDVSVPEEITEDNLADALKSTDPVLKYRPTIAERCIIDCPLAAREK